MTQRSNEQNGSRQTGSDSDVIDAVDRTLAILECFSTQRPELGISEISRELGIHKSTVFRSLISLEARGLVVKDPRTRRYAVGPKILKPAGAYLSRVDLQEKARPHMEAICTMTKETVSLYVPAGDRCVCIDRVESPLEVRRVIRIGEQVPLHLGSSGKVLLAHLPDSVRAELLSRFVDDPMNPLSAADRESLERQVAMIRQEGFATSHEERVSMVFSASAPIFDSGGEVAAALTVSGPTARFNEERALQYAELVRRAALEISEEMGHGLYRGRF